MKIKGIKIVSDGTIWGTKVFTSDGEDITSKLEIKQIEWSHSATGLPIAKLICQAVSIEASGLGVIKD